MRREITNNQLWLIEHDLAGINETSPGLALLLHRQIAQFYRQNQMLLRILHQRMNEIQKKYILHDKDGKPVYLPAEEGKPRTWQYLDGKAEKEGGGVLTAAEAEREYKAEVSEFLGRSITVEL